MEISVSIQPFFDEDSDILKDYIERIIKNGRYSIHFDYFYENPGLLNFVGEFANRVSIHVHSLVDDVESFSKYRFKSVSVHAEGVMAGQTPIIKLNEIKRWTKGGLVFDLMTNDIERFREDIKLCDYCTVMTVAVGDSGRPFNKRGLTKIKQIKRINPKIKIIIDGGINDKTIKFIKKYPVDMIVVGSFAKKDFDGLKKLV
ncbi:MAG: hypothetical protein LBH47_02245 [Christensenellaceae bacterium]|jgi:pentose-5-phosphate-3-epimerase|nr:hypothetical protein [Christensenellaceae bacterium]